MCRMGVSLYATEARELKACLLVLINNSIKKTGWQVNSVTSIDKGLQESKLFY